MHQLQSHSHLRNPLFTLKQCNGLEPAISREGKVIGTLYGPKDVWAEFVMPLPGQTPAGEVFVRAILFAYQSGT